MKKLLTSILIGALFVLASSRIFAAEGDLAPGATMVAPNATSPKEPPTELQQKLLLLKKLNEQIQQRRQQQGKAPVPTGSAAEQQAAVAAATNMAQTAGSQAQGPMQNQQNPSASPAGMYDDAFAGVVNQMLPMSPEQITRLREIFNETQRSAATPAGVPPRPATTSVSVNLSPQATPPVIRLGAGYITSLVFMDSTGQPWPIEAYSIGDPTAFNIQWDKKGNTLLIQAASFYKRSNLAIILKELDTPVMVTLLSGQEAIDYRVDLRVPGMGPNALATQTSLPESANPVLLDVLNGIPPRGSKALKVTGGDCQAWVANNKLYLRTTLEVISPAWKAVMSSIDGTHAYELQPAPVVLALQRGKDKTLVLTLEGFEQ
jgi:intracellular multiplication protein IcmK